MKIGAPKVGCRSWLAISGGIYVELVLGSRSTDLRAGFGGFEGRALRDGDVLPLGMWPRLADPGYRYFLVDRATRLGESGKAQTNFAFHSRRRLERALTLQLFNA